MRTEKLQIGGMTCANCQKKIEKKLGKTPGVTKANVSYTANSASVTYDPRLIDRIGIEAAITATGYQVLSDGRPHIDKGRAAGLLALVLVIYLVLSMHGLTGSASPFPVAEEGMGYGMLFLIGLLTSVHCIAMCGGINLSQCIPGSLSGNVSAKPKKSTVIIPSIYYNLGRVVSYTVVGAVVGALGAAITFSGSAKGIVQILAGVFMVIMGINMLGIFPSLHKFIPHLP
jgi:copper chaperone CopZ